MRKCTTRDDEPIVFLFTYTNWIGDNSSDYLATGCHVVLGQPLHRQLSAPPQDELAHSCTLRILAAPSNYVFFILPRGGGEGTTSYSSFLVIMSVSFDMSKLQEKHATRFRIY